jgi:membrane protein implicated in regulation of membrane protease activity
MGSIGLWLGGLGIVALVVVVALLAPEDDSLNKSQWTAIWLVAAGVLAVGEMLTAGFFLLPFAVAAAGSGILAILGVGIFLQFAVFGVISVLFLWLLQRFASKDIRGDLLPVGAARYIGASAIVTEPVERLSVSGRVKMGTEDWRATTDSDDTIAPGTEVRVVEVRGARLVVERVDN